MSTYNEVKDATKEMRKALRIGDVIDAYYIDREAAIRCLVISAKKGCEIKIIELARFGKRSTKTTLLELNKWEKIGTMCFTPTKIVAALDYYALGKLAGLAAGAVDFSGEYPTASQDDWKQFSEGYDSNHNL